MPSGSWQASVSQGKIFDLLYSLAENQMVYWKFSCAKLSPICVKEKKGETLVQIHLINMKCRINYDHSSDYILSTFSVTFSVHSQLHSQWWFVTLYPWLLRSYEEDMLTWSWLTFSSQGRRSSAFMLLFIFVKCAYYFIELYLYFIKVDQGNKMICQSMRLM